MPGRPGQPARKSEAADPVLVVLRREVAGSSHSRFQGFRPQFLDFRNFCSSKIEKIYFLDSRHQNKILKFLSFFSIFLYIASISYINHYFRAPSPTKPIKSRPQDQNLPRFLLIARSDHQGPVSAQLCGLSCLCLTLS